MASKPPPSEPLAAWIAERRWFGGKSRRIGGIDQEDVIEVGPGALHVLRVLLDDGESQRYAVPLAPGAGPSDGLEDPAFARRLLEVIRRQERLAGRHGVVRGHRTRAFPDALAADAPVRQVGGEQSNTSVVFGDLVIVKHFRRLAVGVNPDLEITRYLTEGAAFPHTPALAGWLEYEAPEGTATLAVAQSLVSGARDGWEWMLAAMRDDARRAETRPALRRLGEVTARLHLALAAAPASDHALAAEPITDEDVTRWTGAVAAQLAAARAAAPPDAAATIASQPVELIVEAFGGLRGRVKCRHHGDFHLGQTLHREASGEWTIIDFEGEPLRPLAERRQKHSPLRDVAGMLRSIAYAAETTRAAAADDATRAAGGGESARAGGATPWVDAWEREARAALLHGYLAAAGRAPFLPADESAVRRALAAFELEKAAYEVVYEANNRPDWLGIPLRGVVSAAAALRPRPAAGAA
jgi:trehalose synthase-fused probable maltokinase